MPQKDVAHNNIDIVLKALGNEYKNKSFSAYGLELPPIVDFRPTELPIVTGRQKFADHVFDLADGSHAIVDYESRYRVKNFIKYGNYATRVLERDLKERKKYKLIFIVVYSGDVLSAPAEYSTDCLTIKVKNVFLSRLNSDEIYSGIMKKISQGEPLTDIEQMRLIILPLTKRGKDLKIAPADKVIDATQQIKAQNVRSFVLSGLAISGAGFLTEEQDIKIMEALEMTRVGELFLKKIESKYKDDLKKAREESKKAREEGKKAREESKKAREESKKAREDGILSSICNLMDSMSWSAQEAMNMLKISPAEQKQYAMLLNA